MVGRVCFREIEIIGMGLENSCECSMDTDVEASNFCLFVPGSYLCHVTFQHFLVEVLGCFLFMAFQVLADASIRQNVF